MECSLPLVFQGSAPPLSHLNNRFGCFLVLIVYPGGRNQQSTVNDRGEAQE